MILNNDYIYKYILPGKADPARPYGSTTYSNKLIFKTLAGGMYVVSLPTSEIMANPKERDFRLTKFFKSGTFHIGFGE